jgi:hypothetical protein
MFIPTPRNQTSASAKPFPHSTAPGLSEEKKGVEKMYSRRTVRRNAVIDAKNNIPDKDDPNPSQFEQELMAMARHEARQVTSKYTPKLETLTGKHKPLLKDYERISKDYDAHSSKIERSEPNVELSRGKYYILMFLFVLGEIPMNSLAFAVFGESQIFTWIMAVGVAVAIPWIAHAVGILLKRGSEPWWKHALGVSSLLLLTVAGLMAIGYVRVQYLGDLSDSGAVAGFGNSKFIGASFIGLNLVILAAATLCSYFAHDHDPKLEHLHRRTNQLNKKLRSIEAKHNKILTKQKQRINKIHQSTQEVIYHYRKINQRLRPDHAKPRSFEEKHQMEVDVEKAEDHRDMLSSTLRLKKAAG